MAFFNNQLIVKIKILFFRVAFKTGDISLTAIWFNSSIQHRNFKNIDSQDMLVLSITVASHYYNCCRDGSTNPGNYEYPLIALLYRNSNHYTSVTNIFHNLHFTKNVLTKINKDMKDSTASC
jgi:hypothetical protein